VPRTCPSSRCPQRCTSGERRRGRFRDPISETIISNATFGYDIQIKMGDSSIRDVFTEGEDLGTVDFLVLTSWVTFCIENIITFFYKTSYLNEEINGIEPSLSVSTPCLH
jgi:hypothetical protein